MSTANYWSLVVTAAINSCSCYIITTSLFNKAIWRSIGLVYLLIGPHNYCWLGQVATDRAANLLKTLYFLPTTGPCDFTLAQADLCYGPIGPPVIFVLKTLIRTIMLQTTSGLTTVASALFILILCCMITLSYSALPEKCKHNRQRQPLSCLGALPNCNFFSKCAAKDSLGVPRWVMGSSDSRPSLRGEGERGKERERERERESQDGKQNSTVCL